MLFDFTPLGKITGRISQTISLIKNKKQRERLCSVQEQDPFVAFAHIWSQSSSSLAQKYIHVHGASVFGKIMAIVWYFKDIHLIPSALDFLNVGGNLGLVQSKKKILLSYSLNPSKRLILMEVSTNIDFNTIYLC